MEHDHIIVFGGKAHCVCIRQQTTQNIVQKQN